MRTQEQLEQAIAALEAQRSLLGDTAVEAALAAVRQELVAVAHEAEGRLPGHPEVGPAERKLVTVMFADISGFTALSEKLDPETVRDLMNDCFGRLVPIVEKYEGTVDKFIGDEIMALFGAPVTHENDPERAVAAALEMMETLAAFNGERGLDLGMHFGINTGPVIAGSVGSNQRQNYSVMGDAVNLASRLEDLSERGEILVGPDTYRLTEKLFTFEPMAPIRVKGKSEPIQVYRVLGFQRAEYRSEGAARGRVASALVGRDHEFATLFQSVRQLSAGRGAIVGIIGDPGLGKSRLVAELRAAILRNRDGSSIQWLEGRPLSFGQAISYRPFQEIVWRFAGITESCEAAEAWRRLSERVKSLLGAQADEILPYLGSLVSLEVPEEYSDRVRYLDGEAMKRRIFFAARRFFEACAQEKPVALVFEDLHWVDESSAALIEHLMPLVERTPLAIINVSRPDPKTPAAMLREIAQREHAATYTEIVLTPLSPNASAQMAHNILNMDAISQKIEEAILRKAEGNPFFLEEIIRSLIDGGKLVRDSLTGRWKASDLDLTEIPDTIQGVIMARVDRLAEDLRQVLRTASVIGRSFFYQVLRAVQDVDRKLDKHLSDLQELEFIREKGGGIDLEYMFKHAIAQQATYGSILLKTRRELHAKVAQAMESLFPDRLEEIYSLVASHYARAELWDKAQHYLRLAGDHAGRVAADSEALMNYEQALDAYQKAFGDQWDPFERAALHRKMGEALFRRGDHSRAIEYLNAALAYLGKPLPATPWATRWGVVKELVKQIGHSLAPALFCASLETSADPRVEEEIRLYEVIGWIDAFETYDHFFLVALRALNVSERRGYPSGVAKGLMAMGTILDIASLFRIAEWYHRRARAAADSIDHVAARALSHMGMALHRICLGQWDLAVNHARTCAQLYQQTGDIHGQGYAGYMTAVAMAYKGSLGEALIESREVVKLGDDGVDPQVKCWGLATQGFVLRLMGRFDDAALTLTQAAELAEKIHDHVLIIWSNSELGRCHLREGRIDAAEKALGLAQELYSQHMRIRLIWAPLRSALCEWRIAEYGRAPEGRGNERLKQAGRTCRHAVAGGKTYRGLLPEAMRLMGAYEFVRGNVRRARKWWKRSAALAEKQGQRHDVTETAREMRTRLALDSHSEKAP